MASKIPHKAGYYWVRMFRPDGTLVVACLTPYGQVLLAGDRKLYSPYGDVAEWVSSIGLKQCWPL